MFLEVIVEGIFCWRLGCSLKPLPCRAPCRLWTPTVTLHRDADELARATLGESAPDAAGPATRIAEARNAASAAGVVRAFNSFTRSLWF